MSHKLTKKQTLILDYISDFISENDTSPSYREIAAALNLASVASVAEHINNLIEKGYLKKNPGAARSLEIIDNSHTETVELFRTHIYLATPEEKKILEKAANILGLELG